MTDAHTTGLSVARDERAQTRRRYVPCNSMPTALAVSRGGNVDYRTMIKTVVRLVVISFVASLMCSGCTHWLPIEPNFGKGELRRVAQVRVCADGIEVIQDAAIKWPMLTGTIHGQPVTFDLRLTPAERAEIDFMPGGPGGGEELPRHCKSGGPAGTTGTAGAATTSSIDRQASMRLLTPASPLATAEFASSPFRFETRLGHRGMRKAGWVLLGVGYSLAAVPGLLVAIFAKPPVSIAAGTLLIPAAGPVVSSIVLSDIKEWGIPWLVLDLPLQVIGIALIGQSYRTKQLTVTIKKPDEPSVSLRPYLTPEGSGLLAVGRF